MGYDIAIIRELLEAAFSEEDLSNFCFDHYKPVYEQFTTGQTKSTRVRLLITYAEKNNLIDDLLDKVKKKNPHKYGEFEPGLKASPVGKGEIKFAVSLGKLPSTNPELFGREKELKILDEAWADPKTNIVSLVAWGGVGKTALVNTWLGRMRADSFRGAERAFGWSFYSQGASEDKQASADQFIATALTWFGDPDPTKGTPWEKGERLAELMRKQKTLLILDGMEPLQHREEGRIRDPGLQSLVRELASYNPGLCVITTRLDVDDIKDFTATTAVNIPLENLSDEAGMQLLKFLGVKGKDDEIRQAVRDFDGHALALRLLGSYLSIVYKGDVQKRDRIAKLTIEKKYGGRARQVMESYEKLFKNQPELDILRMMGLFNRPAEVGAVDALRAEPAIRGLTSNLKSHEDWKFALDNLRRAGLLAKEDPSVPDTLDCHPLIREHFGEKLRENNPEAWKEAHSRLYEYYKTRTKEYPGTFEEMTQLYAAVAHGCRAGRHNEALGEVYIRRIQRGDESFNTGKLGEFGADLAIISCFFDLTWSQPVAELTKCNTAFVFNQAGYDLMALGRLKEAEQPMKDGFNICISIKKWKNAALLAINLSELFIARGDVVSALDYAQQSVNLADISSDPIVQSSAQVVLADSLHQAGHIAEAEAAFHDAENMQKKIKPEYLYLFALRGFLYCDLLLSQEKYLDVQNRAIQTLEWAEKSQRLLEIALDRLSLGRSYMLQALEKGTHDFIEALTYLNQAVAGLQKAGNKHYLPRGLMSRAELYRVRRDFDKAQRDLDEAAVIAERGGMGLHKADCHLGYARLYLAMDDTEKARKSLAAASEMIRKMGYHRRDREVEELEGSLAVPFS
ncbi:MAG TPA: hypothetical protein VJJ51_14720 [Candidatus Methanoperedens sp.]|nr:hypothetical protein [Candidatus Methanoperedens sp.]